MRCIAIDDEPIALSVITQYCSRLEGVELMTFTDPMEGLEAVKATSPALLFLDIEMGDVHGVALAKEVPQSTHIIFTTAYSKFAIDGYDLGVVDFLHKPFSFARFTKAVERVQSRIEALKLSQKIDESSQSKDDVTDSITVRVEYRNVTIMLKDITHIEAMDNYIRIHTANTPKPITSLMSLKSISLELPEQRFMRIHRSYIVSRRWIASYTKSEITLQSSLLKIPIGRIYSDEFLTWLA